MSTRTIWIGAMAALVAAAAPARAEDDEAVSCGEDGAGHPMCTVRSVTPEVKRVLDKMPDRANLLLSFEEDAGDAELATVTRLPWLTSLSLYRCDKITTLAPLAKLKKLAYLDVSGTHATSFAPLAKLGALAELDASMSMDLEDLKPLAALRKLRVLKLSMAATDLAPLAGLKSLRHLEVNAPDDWKPLQKLTQLEELHVSFVEEKDLSVFAGFVNLRILEISQAGKVADIAALARLTKLTRLRLEKTAVTDISPLSSLTALEFLVFSQSPFTTLDALAPLTHLQHLNVSGSAVTSLAPLAKLTGLQTLGITDTAVKDFTPLDATVGTLTTLWVPKGTEAAVAWIKKKNPRVSIFHQ